MQTPLQRVESEAWAKIEDVTISCSPQKAKLEDSLAFTVGFKLKGGIRRNFVQRLWEAAYDQHDLGLRMVYWVEIRRKKIRLLSSPLAKRDKLIRRAVFFWTRNPELPHRVWMTVATEFETILYPKTEEEAQDMLFNVTRTFELPASTLGRGPHSLEAEVKAKWGRHIFTEKGEASAKSSILKVHIE